jgi:hypothetical protein
MKRTALIISKNLSRGQAANVSAILMGQAARLDLELYSEQAVSDRDGNRHSSVKFSIVVLEANGSEQISNHVSRLRTEFPELVLSLFSSEGQGLNNEFLKYADLVSSKTTRELTPVGLMVTGEELRVRDATKKFSLAS